MVGRYIRWFLAKEAIVRNETPAGIKVPRQPRGDARGNPGNAENPDGKDTSIYMAISIHSHILNPYNTSAYRFEPNKTPTAIRKKYILWSKTKFAILNFTTKRRSINQAGKYPRANPKRSEQPHPGEDIHRRIYRPTTTSSAWTLIPQVRR